MSALRSDASEAIPGQDETHRRIHDLLASVTAAVLEEQPGLAGFQDHRPQRDRSSGDSWHGLQTLCHVSALLAGIGRPDPSDTATCRLVEAVQRAAAARGMSRREDRFAAGMTTVSWGSGAGDLLELVLGVRVAVRAISAPFLPGSLTPMASTSPLSALSPLTPPPRRVR